MRKISTAALFKLLTVAALLLAAASFALAQTRDLRLISAQAGGVNFVSGQVTVARKDLTNTQALAATDELGAGDVVETGGDGRVEVLLNPGSYLRVGPNAEFELSDNSLDKLSLKLTRGAAVVEATGFDDPLFVINLDMPRGRVRIIRDGLYRFNVAADGAGLVAVYKGRVMVGETATVVKGGQTAEVGRNGALALAKLDKKNTDALDEWSRARAEELAKLNSNLTRNTVAMNTLARWQGWDSLYGSSWSNSINGYWFRLNQSGYVYVPFLGYYRTTPYGHHYRCQLRWPPPTQARDCADCGLARAGRTQNNSSAAAGQSTVVRQSKSPTFDSAPVSKFPGGESHKLPDMSRPEPMPRASSAPAERSMSEPRSAPTDSSPRGGVRPPEK